MVNLNAMMHPRKVRNEYRFDRPLTAGERELLTNLIGWRPGSRLIVDESGAVVACIAHPDDIAAFENAQRRLSGRKESLRAVQVTPEAAKDHEPPTGFSENAQNSAPKGKKRRRWTPNTTRGAKVAHGSI